MNEKEKPFPHYLTIGENLLGRTKLQKGKDEKTRKVWEIKKKESGQPICLVISI